jgi:hypothetical protein
VAIVDIQYQRDAATGQVLFDATGAPLIVADPTANTYQQLQTRVQYEALGAATAVDVQNAIQDAIQQYERETFWFNEMRTFELSFSPGWYLNGGFINLTLPTSYPTSSAGLSPGALYANGGFISAVGGYTPVPGPPIFFMGSSPATIAGLNAAIFPIVDPLVAGQIWVDGGFLVVSGASNISSSGLQTVAGKEFYSSQDLPTLINMPHVRKIMVLAFANRYPLRERTQQWIDDQSISTTWQGLPTDWCWVGNAIRIYPVPNGGYPLILEGTIRFAPLVNPTDFNCWTNRAEWLIRTEAKRLLAQNIDRNAERVQAMEMEIFGNPQTGRQGALAQLRRESMRRAGGTGRLRPSRGYF